MAAVISSKIDLIAISLQGTTLESAGLPPLEVDPCEQKHRVVVRCIAAEAIIVRAAAIELVVDRILQRELHVLPGQIVELRDPSAAVGAAARATCDGSSVRVVKQCIGAAR